MSEVWGKIMNNPVMHAWLKSLRAEVSEMSSVFADPPCAHREPAGHTDEDARKANKSYEDALKANEAFMMIADGIRKLQKIIKA